MESSHDLRRNDRLTLHVVLSDLEAPVRIDEARICWAQEDRFGVEFLVLSEEARQRLSRVLQTRFEAGVLVELRGHPLFAVRMPVTFRGDAAEGQGHVLNISTGGCAVESETVLPTGTSVQLSLIVQDNGSPLLIDRATVRWSSDRRFGVEFTLMHPEAQTALRQFLMRCPSDRV